MTFRINCKEEDALIDVGPICLSENINWLLHQSEGFKDVIENFLTRYVQGDFGKVYFDDIDVNWAVLDGKIPGFTYSEYPYKAFTIVISTAMFVSDNDHTTIYLKEEF